MAAVCAWSAAESFLPLCSFCVTHRCVRGGESNLIQACEDSFQFVGIFILTHKFARSPQLLEEIEGECNRLHTRDFLALPLCCLHIPFSDLIIMIGVGIFEMRFNF